MNHKQKQEWLVHRMNDRFNQIQKQTQYDQDKNRQLVNDIDSINSQYQEQIDQCKLGLQDMKDQSQQYFQDLEQKRNQRNELSEEQRMIKVYSINMDGIRQEVNHRLQEQKQQEQEWKEQIDQQTDRQNRLNVDIDRINKQYPIQQQTLQRDNKRIRMNNNRIIESKGNIRVFCRIRPLLGVDGDRENIKIDGNMIRLYVPECQLKSDNTIKEHTFYFEQIFDKNDNQENVFGNLEELIQSSIDGYNVCIFAYGQTGSGKTFTMEGEDGPDQIGIIGRSVGFIFQTIHQMQKENWKFQLKVSYQEIYMEQQVDLLKKSESHSIGVIQVESDQEIYKLLKEGRINRSVAATNINKQSSRSHSIFQLFIEGIQSNNKNVIKGSLNLIDLAGSERLNDSQTQGQQLKETKFINKSLTSLGDVITALKNNGKHVPYRNSCLTNVLSQYLEGDSKTLMMVNISPEEKSFSQTLQSLRFADKVADCKKKKQEQSYN